MKLGGNSRSGYARWVGARRGDKAEPETRYVTRRDAFDLTTASYVELLLYTIYYWSLSIFVLA